MPATPPHVIVAFPDPPLTLAGIKVHGSPEVGDTVKFNETVPVNPPDGLIVRIDVPL